MIILDYRQLDLNTITPQLLEPIYSRKQKRLISNAIFTFDIETTSLYYLDNKWQVWQDGRDYDNIPQAAICYLWQFGINDVVYQGRTLEDFHKFLVALAQRIKMPFTIWVHNLGYETQFLRNIFEKFQVFARQPRQPMYFICEDDGLSNVQFRDSLILTQYRLEKCGQLYAPPDVQKLMGNLDYNALHLPHLPLKPKELQYGINDCRVLYHTIMHYRDKYKTIEGIPLTHTGTVRRVLQRHLHDNSPEYYNQVRDCVPIPREFQLLTSAFSGGSVIGNPCYSGRTVENVGSNDFASSYPWQMLRCNQFPISRFYLKPNGDKSMLSDASKCSVMIVKFCGLESRHNVHYIPHARLISVLGGEYDNGKLIRCKECTIAITDIDLSIIERVYYIDSWEIVELWQAQRGSINNEYRRYIVNCYQNKVALKNVAGCEEEYADYKTIINALYGIFVTNIIRPEIIYISQDWETKAVNVAEKLLELKRNYNNVNIYSQGVYVTALARKALWDIIIELDKLGVFVYSDTDSHKYLIRTNSRNAVKKLFADYNKKVIAEHKQVAEDLGVDVSMLSPIDSEGKPRPIGISEYEGSYFEFCQRGAKKYCYRDNKGVHVTVAGLSKTKAVTKGSPLHTVADFEKDLLFDYNHSGRLIHTYIDNQPSVTIDGHTYEYKYGLTLRPATYQLSDTPDYSDYIMRTQGLIV